MMRALAKIDQAWTMVLTWSVALVVLAGMMLLIVRGAVGRCFVSWRVGSAARVLCGRREQKKTKENKRKNEKKKRKKAEGPAPEAKRLSANFDPPKLLVLILFSFALPTSK